MDFGYCLGVLHHVPDTQAGLNSAVAKLKPGAPFLLYLYYAFGNRPAWFAALWKLSEILRFALSRSPFAVRFVGSQVVAAVIYYPLARLAGLFEKLGLAVESFPPSAYRKNSFYTMRTDALDRLGTRLEKRFTRVHIQQMMERAKLTGITFSESVPYWCAAGTRAL